MDEAQNQIKTKVWLTSVHCHLTSPHALPFATVGLLLSTEAALIMHPDCPAEWLTAKPSVSTSLHMVTVHRHTSNIHQASGRVAADLLQPMKTKKEKKTDFDSLIAYSQGTQ